MLRLVISGNPAGKKNSLQSVRNPRTGKHSIVQGKRYKAFQTDALQQIARQMINIQPQGLPYACPIQVRCLYYRDSRHPVDLVNLLNATSDILTDAGIIEDDNARIIRSYDGSRVFYDRENPRTEIEIDYFTEGDGGMTPPSKNRNMEEKDV